MNDLCDTKLLLVKETALGQKPYWSTSCISKKFGRLVALKIVFE
jgi:hypothetical protein